MSPTGTPDEYAAALPAVGKIAVYQYYIVAEDSLSQYVVSPAAAPAEYYAFHAGESSPTALDTRPGDVPADFTLEQNYPNPFNPSTTIRFGVPNAAHVRLRVYTTSGEEVAELGNGEVGAGWHSVRWDAGAGFSSGMYFYTLEIHTSQPEVSRLLSGRMLLLK
jgi:hypothetical protein